MPRRSAARTGLDTAITAGVLAARLTYLDSPSALQGAVAAEILGAGETFLGATEQCARTLQELAGTGDIDGYLDGVVAAGKRVPGIGHPFHKPVDPRTPVLFALAEELLDDTPHCQLLVALQERAAERFGKVLPVNADGATAAIHSDVGLSWQVCRGFAVVSRSAGIVGHLHDEVTAPIGKAVWDGARAVRAPGRLRPGVGTLLPGRCATRDAGRPRPPVVFRSEFSAVPGRRCRKRRRR